VACVIVVACGAHITHTRVTSSGTAVRITTPIFAAGIDDRIPAEEWTAAQARADEAPDSEITFSPVTFSVPASDIDGLTKEDGSWLLASHLASVLYDEGEAAAEALIAEPPRHETEDEEGQGALSIGPLAVLSAERHSSFQTAFLASLVPVIITLGAVVLFSRGAGRVGAPAFVLALATAPLAFGWLVIGSAAGTPEPGDDEFLLSMREVISDEAAGIRNIFLVIAGLSILASVGAFFTGIGIAVHQRVRRPAEEEETGTAVTPPPPIAIPVRSADQPGS